MTRKAIFLDRDGVINKNRSDYVKNISELEIFPNIAELIKKLKDFGFLVIVITNQSAINRGLTTHKNINKIHQAIQNFLQKKETSIDSFYYCPHRPDENCICRKPKPGLIIQASNELKIDLNSSWMIGDNDSDIKSGELAGCNSIKINSTFNLDDAVNMIKKNIKCELD
jgi:D,D-heptose 1,7-bisphosphate phosphatase